MRATSSGFSGRNGSSVVLVRAGGIDAALHADLVDHLVEAEGGGDHADRADDRACVGIDLIAGEREHVAARGGDILGEHIDLEILLLGERADALDRSAPTAPPSRRAN